MTKCPTNKVRCRKCAFIPTEQAKQRECYRGRPCDKLRYYHFNAGRINQDRKKKYAVKVGKVVDELKVALPEKPAVYRHYYRATQNSPVHALGAELWVGQRKVSVIGPVHTLAWTEADVKSFWRSVLETFSKKVPGKVIRGFEDNLNIPPSRCPIRPCPLHEGN